MPQENILFSGFWNTINKEFIRYYRFDIDEKDRSFKSDKR